MAQDMVVLSPEKTVLTYRLAGVGSRNDRNGRKSDCTSQNNEGG